MAFTTNMSEFKYTVLLTAIFKYTVKQVSMCILIKKKKNNNCVVCTYLNWSRVRCSVLLIFFSHYIEIQRIIDVFNDMS